MKATIAGHVSKSYIPSNKLLVLFLLLSLAVSACGTSTELPATPIPIPAPVIVLSGPCELSPGKTIPLSVTGISGADIVYHWTASVGNVNPPDGPVVTYTGPETPQDVIIRVEAEKNGVTSDATINCTVTGPTATPEIPTPVSSPTPLPTKWACTSYRSEKIGTAEVPGEVKIDTPLPGTTDIPSKQDVQVNGSYTGIPEGMYLWVFIYSADAGLHGRYYPQTKDALHVWQPDPTTGQDGHWTLKVNFGAPNLCYEIIVVMANAEASQSIADQLKNWADVNNYAGYELNGPASANPPDAPGFPEGLVEKASIEVRTK